jgi:hypothetical protein
VTPPPGGEAPGTRSIRRVVEIHPVTKIGFNAALNALTVIGLFAE